MKNNETLQKDVQDALKWEPLLNAAEIGVIVQDGVVTLTGTVDSYAKKIEAEDAVKNVNGVRAVVEKIEIKFDKAALQDDTSLAKEIVNAFTWNWEVPNDKVKVKVESGWVTLEGELQWSYQKEAATKAVNNLNGVTGITNHISLKSSSPDGIEKQAIERALMRNWSIDDKKIEVKVVDNTVTLNGTVHSLYQKEAAGRIAGNAPGVWAVDNELVIE